MGKRTDRQTVPQIFIDGKGVGEYRMSVQRLTLTSLTQGGATNYMRSMQLVSLMLCLG